MTWQEHADPGLTITGSSHETARFGMTFARATVGTASAAKITSALRGRGEDVVVVRFDASRRDVGAALARTRRVVIPAGTLTYWERPAALGSLDLPTAGLRVVAADDATAPGVDELDRVISDSFAAYGNHYAANPLLDPALALAGYQEWARRSLSTERNEVAFLLEGNEVVGAATIEVGSEEVEILLAGLVGHAQGRGGYRVLLAWCVERAAAHGASRVVISTQADNVRVQRAWARAGFVPFAAVETVHLVRADHPGITGS